MYAIEERMQWQDSLQNNELPTELEEYILWYKNFRNDYSWRSTRLVEALGEVALHWYEERMRNNGQGKGAVIEPVE